MCLDKTVNKRNALIVDGQALARFGIRTALESLQKFNIILEAQNASEGLELFNNHKPDLVITDINLPDTSGIELIREFKDQDNDVKIIVLSSNNTEAEILEAIFAGARAYCTKDTNTSKLLNIIETVCEGAIWFDAPTSNNILNIVKNSRINDDTALPDEEIAQLTDRETDVLKLIVDGHNNAEISRRLCVSIHTAKAHVCSILHKLQVEDRTQAAIRALKNKII